MTNVIRLTPSTSLAAVALGIAVAISLALGSSTATAATHLSKAGSTKPVAGKSAKQAGKASFKSSKVKTAKSRGPAVINMPSPPAAVLSALHESTIKTGCVDAAGGAGLSASDLQALMSRALMSQALNAERNAAPGAEPCSSFVSVSMPGAAETAASYALLPAGDRRAFVTTLGARAPASHWQDIELNPIGQREVWLPSGGAGPNGADMAEEIPPTLQHEIGLLVKKMRKQSGTPDSTWVRAWIDGEGDAATLLAVELVDELTGQAVDSALWMARDNEPGAFISKRGIEYERMLWQSPVDYKRISRGIGASTMLVHKRVVVMVKGKAKPRLVVRAFMMRGQHIGIDFAAPTGTPVVSVAEGEVVFSGWRGGYGNLVVVQHGTELATYYGHLSAFAQELAEGARVRRGQTIGLVGSTGFSTGPHLHFEIRKDARYVDPTKLDQKLAAWTLRPDEHEAVLTRLLQLEATRASGFARSARVQMVLRQQGGAEAQGQ